MLGAIIGDMVGSIYEFNNRKTKEFNILDSEMHMTDDSLLTIAVAKVLLKHYPLSYSDNELKEIKEDLILAFVSTWATNPQAGFGGMFTKWCMNCLKGKSPLPYNSYGNGSAMRISPVGWIAKSEDEVKLLSKTVTEITHNHPEGIKGAEAVAMCIYMALQGKSKEVIKDRMIKEYYPEIENFDFEELKETYEFNATCQGSVPQAIYCFLISTSLEDAIRNCIAIGGDCDTTAAIAGSIAEAYYQKDALSDFEDKFMYFKIDPKIEKEIACFYETIGSKKLTNTN